MAALMAVCCVERSRKIKVLMLLCARNHLSKPRGDESEITQNKQECRSVGETPGRKDKTKNQEGGKRFMKGRQSHCDSRTVGVRNAAHPTPWWWWWWRKGIFIGGNFPLRDASRSRGRGERVRAAPEEENLCKFAVKSLEELFEWEIFPLNPRSERLQTNTLQKRTTRQHLRKLLSDILL